MFGGETWFNTSAHVISEVALGGADRQHERIREWRDDATVLSPGPKKSGAVFSEVQNSLRKQVVGTANLDSVLGLVTRCPLEIHTDKVQTV